MLIHLYRCGERCGIASSSRRKARTWYVSVDTSHLLRSQSLIRYAVSEVLLDNTPLDVRQPPVSAPLPVACRVPRLAVRHMGCEEPQSLDTFIWDPQILPARRSGEFDCTVGSTRTSVTEEAYQILGRSSDIRPRSWQKIIYYGIITAIGG